MSKLDVFLWLTVKRDNEVSKKIATNSKKMSDK